MEGTAQARRAVPSHDPFIMGAKLPRNRSKDIKSWLMKEHQRKKKEKKQKAPSHLPPHHESFEVHESRSVRPTSASEIAFAAHSPGAAITVSQSKAADPSRAVVTLGRVKSNTFHNPLLQATAYLDKESRVYLWRWLSIPRWISNVPPKSVRSWIAYTVPLMTKYPIMGHWLALLSSFQLDGTKTNMLAIRNHAKIVRMVNQCIGRPQEANDYNTILLGIQAGMSSAFMLGDMTEMNMHIRGREHFLKVYGLPKHPLVMVHIIVDSLGFGPAILGVDSDASLRPDSAINDMEHKVSKSPPWSQDLLTPDTLMDIHELATLIESLQRVQSIPEEQLRRQRQPAEQKLFAPGALLQVALTWPLRRALESTKELSFRELDLKLAHHPYLVIYLTLLHFDLSYQPSQQQEGEYRTLVDIFDYHTEMNAWVPASLAINILVRYKHESNRAWKAVRLLHVLFRLPEDKSRHILHLLIWYVCLDPSIRPPIQDLDVYGVLSETRQSPSSWHDEQH